MIDSPNKSKNKPNLTRAMMELRFLPPPQREGSEWNRVCGANGITNARLKDPAAIHLSGISVTVSLRRK